jgi:hypothetical protein
MNDSILTGSRVRLVITQLVLAVVVASAATAIAGTICGTVTDANTGLPVAGAGIFARYPDGSYAGALATTDAGGAWCLENLAAGTYTLEIRVDDYLTVYRNGIEVTGDLSNVPIAVTRAAVSLDPPWPNPAGEAVKMRVHVTRPAPLDLRVFDLRGRLVRAWTATSLDPGTREYTWDGRDLRGRLAPAGLYVIRMRSSDQLATRSLILTR